MSGVDSSAGEIPPGHRRIGCTGKWIDISTLTNRYVLMCTSCRASRSMRPEEIQCGEFSDSPPVPEPAVDIGSPVRPVVDPMVRFALLATAAAAFLVGLILGHYA